MSNPASREQLIDFCKRQLGHPVIAINVDDDQVEDCIDLALQFFQDFHFDGTEKQYLKHQLTSTDITNQYIPVNENVIGITRIFPLSSSNATINMFDLRYQLRLHELYDFTSTSYVPYTLTMQHIRTLDLLFSGEQPIRFNRHTDKLYLDWNWTQYAIEGEYLIIEAFVVVDPDSYTDIYNDRMLKKLSTAYVKKVWANNMRKYGGLQLPGGVTLNGQQMYEEAMGEIENIENQIRNTYEAPPMFLVG
jgi:hypothetical protein